MLDLNPGTGISNLFLSSGESANFRFLALADANRAGRSSAAGHPQTWPVWLGEQLADTRQLKPLLAPCPSEAMTCWPVSARVGNVKNNDPSLVEPVAGIA